jgi:NADH:ubiquinone oxidoreductase subunit 5 (subunit L)/multisubunit Na+/H+ antiporter MnhA subunit
VGVYEVALAVLLLPVAGIALSYLAESRRGAAGTVLASSWLALLASLVLLGAVAADNRTLHSETITFWSFQVVQSPFNAAATTVLAQTFKVGVGYAATPSGAILAVLVALLTLLGELQLAIQFRRDHRLATLARLGNLLGFGALLVVLAPELFQVVLGFELCGLAAALLAGAAVGPRAGSAARSGYLVWRLGGLSLLLGVAFIYVKFSGPVATAAAAAAARAAKLKQVLATPDGLNLVALDHIWVAAARGLATGVGGRSLTLAAVLLVVAAACACGQIPLHGLWRSLGNAPGAAAGLVLSIAVVVVGPAVLLDSYTLLRLASGVLPALVVLATLSSLATATLALREHRLRRLVIWIVASQTGMVLVALGLGSRAAAVALLLSSALAATALVGVVSHLGRNLRVDSVSQLGAAWSLNRRPVTALLAALAAATGVVGLGTFFGHADLLAIALGGAGHAGPTPPSIFRVVGAAGALLTMLLVAAAGARVALLAIQGEESSDPREARLLRRQLAQGQGLHPLWPSLAATGLALLCGLVAIPGVGWGLGALMAPRAGRTLIPVQAVALVLSLAVPLLGLGAVAVFRARLGAAASPDPSWLAWLDGGRLAVAAEAFAIGGAARAVEMGESRVLEPAGDAVGAVLGDLLQRPPGRLAGRLSWSWTSGLVAVAGLALTVAFVVWVAASHAAGLGLP